MEAKTCNNCFILLHNGKMPLRNWITVRGDVFSAYIDRSDGIRKIQQGDYCLPCFNLSAKQIAENTKKNVVNILPNGEWRVDWTEGK